MKKRMFFAGVIALCSLFFSLPSSAQNFSQQPILRVGILNFYPPFIYNYNSGFDFSLMSALCKQIGYRCDFYNQAPDEMNTNLQEGKLDAIISAISINLPQLQQLEFTQPYLISTFSFVGLDSVNKKNDVPTYHIGIIDDNNIESYLKSKKVHNATIITEKNYDDLFAAVNDGTIDLMLMHSAVAHYWLEQSNGRLVIVGEPLLIPQASSLGIAVRKGNSFLVEQLNNAIMMLAKNGKYNQIINLYFDVNLNLFDKGVENAAGIYPPAWLIPYLT